MNEALKGVHKHILRLGLGALASATYHAHFVSPDNEIWPEMSVLHAAHAAELITKARIAEEHPLLIFDQLPSPGAGGESSLDLEGLIQYGRTVQYQDLPNRLWAVTGVKLPELQIYREFGRLRNTIQHFVSPPGRDLGMETLKFVFRVLDPFMNECWGLFAIDFNEDYEPYDYLVRALVEKSIPFLVSPDVLRWVADSRFTLPKDDPEYYALMGPRLMPR